MRCVLLSVVCSLYFFVVYLFGVVLSFFFGARVANRLKGSVFSDSGRGFFCHAKRGGYYLGHLFLYKNAPRGENEVLINPGCAILATGPKYD